MISSEVQRTLVKSPPELWAELSDPAALARHLGELGEIRITRSEPEKLVEWEAEEATGTVAIKASGWGTKVTLTVNREFEPPHPTTAIDASEAVEDDVDPSEEEVELTATAAARFGHEHPEALLGSDLELAAERDPSAVAEPEAAENVEAAEPAEPEPDLVAESQAEAEAETVAEPVPLPDPPVRAEEVEPEPAAVEPRLGFFARLFGRRRRQAVPAALLTEEPVSDGPDIHESDSVGPVPYEPAIHETDAPGPVSEEPLAAAEPAEEPVVSEATSEAPVASAPEPVAETEPEAELELAEAQVPEPAIDLAAELRAAEEAAEAEVTEILKGVLDRLGAAHHRPFSRS